MRRITWEQARAVILAESKKLDDAGNENVRRVAITCGRTPSSVYDALKMPGHNPSFEMACELAEAVGLTLAELEANVNGTEPTEPAELPAVATDMIRGAVFNAANLTGQSHSVRRLRVIAKRLAAFLGVRVALVVPRCKRTIQRLEPSATEQSSSERFQARLFTMVSCACC